MQIHWARLFPRLDEPMRAEAESRLTGLALERRDLTDARVAAEFSDPHGSQVRVHVRGLIHGHPVASSAEHGELERALGAALGDFERAVHKRRARRRTLGRHWRAPALERALHQP